MSYVRIEGNYVVLEVEDPNTKRRYGQAFSTLDFTVNELQMIKQGHTCSGCVTFTTDGWNDSIKKHRWCMLSRCIANLQSNQKYHMYRDGHVIISSDNDDNNDDDVVEICNKCEFYKFDCRCGSDEMTFCDGCRYRKFDCKCGSDEYGTCDKCGKNMYNCYCPDDEWEEEYRTSSDSFSGRDDK